MKFNFGPTRFDAAPSAPQHSAKHLSEAWRRSRGYGGCELSVAGRLPLPITPPHTPTTYHSKNQCNISSVETDVHFWKTSCIGGSFSTICRGKMRGRSAVPFCVNVYRPRPAIKKPMKKQCFFMVFTTTWGRGEHNRFQNSRNPPNQIVTVPSKNLALRRGF